jgi:hypothetical protein
LNAFADDESSAESHKVFVEPSYVEVTKTEDLFRLMPYKERRGKWGTTVSIAYSSYEPENFESNFVAKENSQPYEKADLPLIEGQLVYKRNTSYGSLGGELGVGMYENESDDPVIESNLSFRMYRLGAVIALDAFAKEPLIVPYGSAGAYMIEYEETLGEVHHKGNTQLAPYLTAGFMFQLDWLDRRSARISYEESGTQSSFAFVEGRTMLASSEESDPDYSSSLHWNAGIRIEF